MSRPVKSWENQQVKGMALSCDRVHDDEMKKVNALRKKHADYLASLPTDRKAAIRAAKVELHSGPSSFSVDFKEALHLSHALRPMLEHLQVDDISEDRDALLWIMDRITRGLERASDKLEHIDDILSAPPQMPSLRPEQHNPAAPGFGRGHVLHCRLR